MLNRIVNTIRKFKRRRYPFELIRHENEITLKSSAGEGYITVTHNDGKLLVDIGGDISFNVNGNCNITSNGETNIVSFKDTNIDTWKSTLNLNCRRAIQIKDIPEAIAYRKEMAQKVVDFQKRLEDYNNQKKIEHQKKIESKNCDCVDCNHECSNIDNCLEEESN